MKIQTNDVATRRSLKSIEESMETKPSTSACRLQGQQTMHARPKISLLAVAATLLLANSGRAFVQTTRRRPAFQSLSFTALSSQSKVDVAQEKITEASQILADWDRQYNPESAGELGDDDADELRARLPDAVRVLNEKARQERTADPSMGRCMLGICASSVDEGIATLKSWVTNLELPRGLLHGADKDGVPLEFNGGVYIKYNSGGVYTFADIRKSQMGFDALWKPGDAMLEEYDGTVRGIYFQVELEDGDFRQYLLPLETMGELGS